MVHAFLAAFILAPQAPGGPGNRILVPDAKTAAAIAEAILIPIYTKERIARQKPFGATLKDGVWHVRGAMPRSSVGGVAELMIKAKDCQVLMIKHGK